jgi:hypothetical protein
MVKHILVITHYKTKKIRVQKNMFRYPNGTNRLLVATLGMISLGGCDLVYNEKFTEAWAAAPLTEAAVCGKYADCPTRVAHATDGDDDKKDKQSDAGLLPPTVDKEIIINEVETAVTVTAPPKETCNASCEYLNKVADQNTPGW